MDELRAKDEDYAMEQMLPTFAPPICDICQVNEKSTVHAIRGLSTECRSLAAASAIVNGI